MKGMSSAMISHWNQYISNYRDRIDPKILKCIGTLDKVSPLRGKETFYTFAEYWATRQVLKTAEACSKNYSDIILKTYRKDLNNRLNKLKEKVKDNPEKLNEETIKLIVQICQRTFSQDTMILHTLFSKRECEIISEPIEIKKEIKEIKVTYYSSIYTQDTPFEPRSRPETPC